MTDNKEMTIEPKCCILCGVPMAIHNTLCGWDNANVIVFPGETTLFPLTVEQKKERWQKYIKMLKNASNQQSSCQQLYGGLTPEQVKEAVELLKRASENEKEIAPSSESTTYFGEQLEAFLSTFSKDETQNGKA